MQAPHTSPRHLNTISQDVETISILKGEERLADRLLGVDWSFAELQEWPLWLTSCQESLAGDGDDHCQAPLPSVDTSHPLISTLGVGLEEGLLPFFLLYLCGLSLT